MRSPKRVSLAVAALCLWASSARAVTQPDGTTIPITNQLGDLFTMRHETINPQRDAAVVPERYLPGCTLTFTLVSRGMATFQNSFGWYNVRGSRPDPSDMHVLIPCTARPGDSFTLDMRHEPAYRGGEIGFFLITPEGNADHCASLLSYTHTYFSERAFNDDAMGARSFIHLLTYDSTVTPQAFYFAWEDLYGGGDNEFTDFVALVQNIQCTGGGGPCDTGHPGACSVGTLQCHAGTLGCMQSVQPSPERCDGIDNDCNGTVDDGAGLCPGVQLCDRGTCVDRCMGELGCFTPLVCSGRGTCVEPGCATVDCPAGQRCVGGACVGACDGVLCPHGQTCRVGRCVDPCAGVACDPDQACVAGVCQPRCECRHCATGHACAADGVCRPSDCAAVTCPSGQYCSTGACHDGCDGARCPAGELCLQGACVRPAPVDGGVPARDAAADAPAMDADDVAATDGATVDTGGVAPAMDAGADAAVVFDQPSGCGCRVGGHTHGAGPPWGLVGGLAWGVRVLRRRRRRAAQTPAPNRPQAPNRP